MNWAPLLSSVVNADGIPSADELNYWVDDLGSPVCTDTGVKTIIDSVIYYWCDDLGNDVCDDTGSTVSLLYIP